MAEAPEKNLALDIVRITEAAALASARWLGRGDKEAGDGAAVDAMRVSFATLNIDGLVIIGEGEKDHAPMLFNGEKVGKGTGPCLDVAVDPVEGTNLLAYGRPNAFRSGRGPARQHVQPRPQLLHAEAGGAPRSPRRGGPGRPGERKSQPRGQSPGQERTGSGGFLCWTNPGTKSSLTTSAPPERAFSCKPTVMWPGRLWPWTRALKWTS